MEFAINQHHRHSIRYLGYDYSQPGAYFITIVTFSRECIFGKFIGNQIQYSHLGNTVFECWYQIPSHFPKVDVEPFIIMPNHIHAIVTINSDDRSRGTIYRAPTGDNQNSSSDHNSNNHVNFGNPIRGSLATIIQTFKAAVSRRAKKELNLANIWQRNYYERIIRNQSEMENIANYISTNLEQWSKDPEYRG